MASNHPGDYSGIHVAYILAMYPSRSESFIRREIETVRKHGATVDIYALRKGIGDATEGEKPESVCYRSEISVVEKIASTLRAMMHPSVMLKRLALTFRDVWRQPMSLLVSLRNMSTAAAFARRIRNSGAKQIHAHFAGEPLRVAETIAAIAGLPFSFSVHARDIFVGKPTVTDTIRQATGAAVCTAAALERMKSLLPDHLHHKVHLVRHGIEMTAEPSSEPPRPTVLFVGRLVEKKGVPVLLDALEILHGRGCRLNCALVGDGSLLPEIEQQIQTMACRDSITLTGWLPNAEVRRMMKGCLALAVPSVVADDGDRDGLPNVILEAAVAQLPVAASDTGGIGEFIANEDTGLLVPPDDAPALADALERLADDSDGLRLKLTENALKKAEQEYNLFANAARLMGVLQWKK